MYLVLFQTVIVFFLPFIDSVNIWDCIGSLYPCEDIGICYNVEDWSVVEPITVGLRIYSFRYCGCVFNILVIVYEGLRSLPIVLVMILFTSITGELSKIAAFLSPDILLVPYSPHITPHCFTPGISQVRHCWFLGPRGCSRGCACSFTWGCTFPWRSWGTCLLLGWSHYSCHKLSSHICTYRHCIVGGCSCTSIGNIHGNWPTVF